MMKNKEDGASFTKRLKAKREARKAKREARKGVKDADTEDMPVVNREKDAMKKEDGASLRVFGIGKKSAGQERRGQKRAKKRKYGKGESGKAKEAAAISREYAAGNLDMMGASMKKYGSSMSGEKYDAKQAYNKNLSASARLHYLENNRADKKTKGTQHRSPIMRHMKGYK
tara:strand:- start:3387 stop:3899 length:513 start_codon:yes stop_codon:yes gene_type:complete